jgi:hypothetical protein
MADRNFIKLSSNGSPEWGAVEAELARREWNFVTVPATETVERKLPEIEMLFLTLNGYHNIRLYMLPGLPPKHELLAAS